MPNEFNKPEKIEREQNRLPPGLAGLESRLAGLGRKSALKLDRDELMFQSGYAAAMATKELCSKGSQSGLSRWGWLVVNGTLGAVAAGLAIMLWSVPLENSKPQFASKSTVETPQMTEPKTSTTNEVLSADNTKALATNNPTENAKLPYFKNMSWMGVFEGSAFQMRNERLADALRDGAEQSQTYTRKSQPRAEPLRAMSFQNQQLWEQL